jgi:predicted ATPase
LEGSAAYQPFIEGLSNYFAIAPPEFLDEDAYQLLGNFAHLIPNIRQMLPDLPVPPSLDPKQEQLRLMTSLALFIKIASQERPWVLILDDLQWADQSSLELLHYLGRHTPSMSLLIIGVYRDMDLDRSHPLRKTLWDLDRYPTYYRLPLERLNETEVGQLLTSLWQQPVPEGLVEKIYQRTQGNPFYVEEVARGLIDDGLIVLNADGGQFPTLETVRLPQTIRDAVLHRINTLGRDAQNLLHQAAVLGQTFRFEDLRAISNLSEREALEGLDVALERQLIQEAPGQMVLRFTHPEIQHVLYETMGALRRRMLHRQAGEALEQRHQTVPNQFAEELAHHFIEAGDIDKAVHYSQIAANQAQATYASQSALMWCLELTEIHQNLDRDRHCRDR